MPHADNRRGHGLLNQGFQIIGEDIPVTDTLAVGQLRTAMAANVAGNHVQLIGQVFDKR